MRICLLQISKSISTPTQQSAGSKWKEIKFQWSAGLCWGNMILHKKMEMSFFGFIKNFFLNEEVN